MSHIVHYEIQTVCTQIMKENALLLIQYSKLYLQVMLSDRQQMIYTEATLLEVMRISTSCNITASHCGIKDTTFHGYNIPRYVTK